MTKFKPLRLYELELNIDNVWVKALLSGAIGGLDAITNSETFFCGKCHALIKVDKSKPLPQVCVGCGEGIDWVGTHTKIIKVCNRCDFKSETAKYCPNHYPAVLLKDVEIPAHWKDTP